MKTTQEWASAGDSEAETRWLQPAQGPLPSLNLPPNPHRAYYEGFQKVRLIGMSQHMNRDHSLCKCMPTVSLPAVWPGWHSQRAKAEARLCLPPTLLRLACIWCRLPLTGEPESRAGRSSQAGGATGRAAVCCGHCAGTHLSSRSAPGVLRAEALHIL